MNLELILLVMILAYCMALSACTFCGEAMEWIYRHGRSSAPGRLSTVLGLALFTAAVIVAGCRSAPPRPPIVSLPIPTASPVPAVATPEPIPSRPRPFWGYWFGRGSKYCADGGCPELPQTIHHVWPLSVCVADELADPGIWLPRMAANIDDAIGRGERLYVGLGAERGVDPRPILELLTESGRYRHVAIIDGADEPAWTRAQFGGNAARLRGLMAEFGWTRDPEIIYTLTQRQSLQGIASVKSLLHPLARGHEPDMGDLGAVPIPRGEGEFLLDASGVDGWAFEAYDDPPGDEGGPERVRAYLRAVRAALPQGKVFVVIPQFYTRNGGMSASLAWLLWEPAVDETINDPRVIAYVGFAHGRPTGLRDILAELGEPARALLERLFERVTDQGVARGPSTAPWTRSRTSKTRTS